MQADMTKPADIERLVDGADTAFGGVDILVNNVGGSRGARIGTPATTTGR